MSEKRYACKGLHLTLNERDAVLEIDLCAIAFRARFGDLWPAEEL